jgi:2-polyprenyl-6-methoxyphenol hydroxylase-like FAD-dependent oxidoreductase
LRRDSALGAKAICSIPKICFIWRSTSSKHIFSKVVVDMVNEIGIVGGGLTGVMMAVAISHSSDSVTLVTNRPLSKKHRPDDRRTTTVNAAGKAMLEVLGIWKNLSKAPVPITRILVAEGPSPNAGDKRQQHDFGLNWHNPNQPMAYVVSNAALLDALCDNLATRPVTVMQPVTVTGMELVSNRARLFSPDKNLPDFDLVIACDGAESPLRGASRLRHFRLSHRQTAITRSTSGKFLSGEKSRALLETSSMPVTVTGCITVTGRVARLSQSASNKAALLTT